MIGYIAAIVSAIIFFPQLLQTVKTKETKDLSLGMYILVTLSNSLWFLYGILSPDYAIILAQTFLLPMGTTILVYKIKYG